MDSAQRLRTEPARNFNVEEIGSQLDPKGPREEGGADTHSGLIGRPAAWPGTSRPPAALRHTFPPLQAGHDVEVQCGADAIHNLKAPAISGVSRILFNVPDLTWGHAREVSDLVDREPQADSDPHKVASREQGPCDVHDACAGWNAIADWPYRVGVHGNHFHGRSLRGQCRLVALAAACDRWNYHF